MQKKRFFPLRSSYPQRQTLADLEQILLQNTGIQVSFAASGIFQQLPAPAISERVHLPAVCPAGRIESPPEIIEPISMLRKYSNHPPAGDDAAESKRRKWRGVLFATLALAILLGTGLALFSRRDALQRAYNHISTGVQAGLERHFPGKPDGRDLLQRLKDMWSGGKPPAASPPGRLEGRDANVDQGTPAGFLYTLELLDGGKIEGKSIVIGKEVITVTDDQGVVVQVNRDRVIRITKIPL